MARLGDILVRRGYITGGQLEAALAAQGSERGMLGRILVRRGLITMDQLGEALAEQFGVPFVEVVPQAVNPQIVRLLPERLARQRSCVPLAVSGSTMQLAMAAPDDIEAISEAELITGYRVDPFVALESPVQAALEANCRAANDRGHENGGPRRGGGCRGG
jgi:type IV pilus assembly protein PilB